MKTFRFEPRMLSGCSPDFWIEYLTIKMITIDTGSRWLSTNPVLDMTKDVLCDNFVSLVTEMRAINENIFLTV